MGDSKAKPLDWTSQLVMLRGMTERFGSLHEAQKLQLQLWPFTVDSAIEGNKANVDMEAKVVEFIWRGSTMKIDSKYRERLGTLAKNVQFLLGSGWSTFVVRDGVPIYPVDTKNGSKTISSRKRRNSKTKRRRARR